MAGPAIKQGDTVLLIGRGRFRCVGLPLKIRGGAGSPVRAVAVFEK
jgi:kynurenine formamidase